MLEQAKTVALLSYAAISLTACLTTPEFAQTGTPTPYDGKWEGVLSSNTSKCAGLTSSIEIRYGQLIGVLRKDGVRTADVWGKLSPDGTLDGNIGKTGISGGTARISFTPDNASGTWKGSGCTGKVKFQKI